MGIEKSNEFLFHSIQPMSVLLYIVYCRHQRLSRLFSLWRMEQIADLLGENEKLEPVVFPNVAAFDSNLI